MLSEEAAAGESNMVDERDGRLYRGDELEAELEGIGELGEWLPSDADMHPKSRYKEHQV
jgi:hypothetical protein